MNIQILQGVKEAEKARGTAVVIDVFRAFSLECYLFSMGAKRVLPVGAIETAERLKEQHPEYTSIGERKGRIIPGFDFGNSPSQVLMDRVKDRTVIHTTSAGTQGVVAASKGADEIITGSLVNARAVANYILGKNPSEVSIICMGVGGIKESPEDTLCGQYIKAILTGGSVDLEEGIRAIRNHKEGMKFFKPELQEVFPAKDFEMCTNIDKFDMVLKVNKIADDIYESVKI
jgi:2-phosphosulfolactate phosphatase